mgnify:CR=1 FL=1
MADSTSSSTYPYSLSCSTDHLWMNFLPDSYYIFLIELNNTAPRGISLSTEDTGLWAPSRRTGFEIEGSVSEPKWMTAWPGQSFFYSQGPCLTLRFVCSTDTVKCIKLCGKFFLLLSEDDRCRLYLLRLLVEGILQKVTAPSACLSEIALN